MILPPGLKIIQTFHAIETKWALELRLEFILLSGQDIHQVQTENVSELIFKKCFKILPVSKS